MSLRPTPLHPHPCSMFLHVIANQCAHWCGNPRPRRESWQPGTTSGKSAAFPYSPKVFPFAMCYRRRTDCPVASLLAMTCSNLLPVHIIPGHCRYAAGKAPLPTCRAPPPCNRTHTPAFCMPLHPTPLQPQTRSIFLHVIANQCAHWCGNPRPRRESWQPGTTSGKSAAFPYSPKVFPFAMCYRRSYGLSRRFAPRNDMQ